MDEVEEQFNKEGKQGWICAADAARITDESAISEKCKRTSGGVSVAGDSDQGGVIDTEEGAVRSILGNETTIAQSWVSVKVYSWQSEGWKPRNEALMEAVVLQARTTRRPWWVACDASLWFKQKCMLLKRQKMVFPLAENV